MSLRVTHPYLHTRVSLMARRLLDATLLLQATGKPLEDARALFTALGAQSLLSEDGDLARRSLEQRRLSLLLQDVLILSRALSGSSREFLRYWTHYLELNNLKAIIRGRLAGQDAAQIRGRLLDMGPFASLPVEDLLRAESELEVLRRLDATPFAEIARQARRVLEERRDLFFLDTTLDRRFLSGLVKRAENVHSSDPESFRRLMGCLIDHTNLLWLLRYRFAYRLAPAETYYLLIPASLRLSGALLQSLAGLPTLEQVLQQLPLSFRTRLAGCTTADEVHGRLERRTRGVALDVIRHSVSAFVRAYAYLLLRMQDLSMLRGLVKAQLLGLDPALTREALRLSPPGAGASRV